MLPSSMRILLLTHYFWPEVHQVSNLATGLVGLGHEVTVVTPIPTYPSGRVHPGHGLFTRRRETWQGVEIRRVPLIPRAGGSGPRLALSYVTAALFSCLHVLRLSLRHYDVVFVFQPSPITTGLAGLVRKALRGTPIAIWVQDLWPETLEATGFVRSPLLLRPVSALVRIIYAGCDLLLAQSRAFATHLESRGISPERIRYFPNSADEFYRPVDVLPDAPERKMLPAAGFIVMYAGNLGFAQDFESVLAAAELLRPDPRIQWVLLGSGAAEGWIRQQVAARELSGCVHLLGNHPAETMPTWLALADALLVTLKKSPIFALTVPSKVQPYLACGRPILAALDGEGARVVEEAGAGYASPAEDPAALAGAVARMADLPPAERIRMGDRGRAYFEAEFQRGMLLRRLDAWLQELAGDGPAQRVRR
jgi:glycosyltransferase involved in cell wall biosynthesis